MKTTAKGLTRKRSRREAKAARVAYAHMIPAFVGLSVLTYIPLVLVLVMSLFKGKSLMGLSGMKFAGFDNYVKMFTTDTQFLPSLQATVTYALMAVLGSMIYSLIIAMLLNRKIPARGFFRAVFYLPYVLPAAAVYVGWSWLYETNFGLFNYILNQLGIEDVMFLSSASAAGPSLALVAVWLSGNLIVIFLAGLQNVPRVYHEAAQIDGAGGFRRFLHITVPSMTPIIFYNLLMSLVTNLQVVTPALALTKGGPANSTMYLSYLMYWKAFKEGYLGYASAISFISFLLIGLFTGILFLTSRSWIFYEGGDD